MRRQLGLCRPPMSEKHMKAFGGEAACAACQGSALPTSRSSDKACIGCHGTMDKIPTKPNAFDKFPHASAHYGNTLECTASGKRLGPTDPFLKPAHFMGTAEASRHASPS